MGNSNKPRPGPGRPVPGPVPPQSPFGAPGQYQQGIKSLNRIIGLHSKFH